MAYDEAAAARLRRILPVDAAIVERRMMGALVFMVDGHMCCGVTGTALMVRLGPAAYAAALAEPQVRPFDIGGRRPGAFILVEEEGYRSDAALARWVGRGLAFVSSLRDGKVAGRRTADRVRRGRGYDAV